VEKVEYFENFCRDCGGRWLWYLENDRWVVIKKCGCNTYSFKLIIPKRVSDGVMVIWKEEIG